MQSLREPQTDKKKCFTGIQSCKDQGLLKPYDIDITKEKKKEYT